MNLFCITRETDEALKIEDNAPIAEKQGEQDDAPPTTVENKDHKDGAAKEEEENEEDKVKATPNCNLCAEITLFI